AGLPAALRADIAAATSRALAQVAASRDWLNPRRADRIARDAREQAIVAIARTCPPRELAELVARQRKCGALTVALLMRALVSGDSGLFRQTLVEMSGLPEGRVAGFLRNFRGQGFAALYGKAGLPGHFLPAFRAALGVLADGASPRDNQISHNLTMRLIRACEKLADPNLASILSMLWRFACESARDDAQEFVADAMHETVLSIRQAEHEAIEQEASPPIVLDNEAPGENFAPPVELELDAPVELEPAPPEKVADAA
ncbi:MAG: DUF2336 domain-containing protein, partial [Roseiarcus sp.]